MLWGLRMMITLLWGFRMMMHMLRGHQIRGNGEIKKEETTRKTTRKPKKKRKSYAVKHGNVEIVKKRGAKNLPSVIGMKGMVVQEPRNIGEIANQARSINILEIVIIFKETVTKIVIVGVD